MNSQIQVKNVSKYFKLNKPKLFSKNKISKNNSQLKALDDVSFEVNEGEILVIIGVNGSGKSTLLRTIAGVYKPDMGTIKVSGRISPLLQLGVGFHNELNAKENILLHGLLIGLSKHFIEDKVEQIIQYAELERFQNMPLKHYSTGMKARLGFSTSLMIDPDIFLIDEILSVGDKNFRIKSFQSIKELKTRNKTILLTTHNIANLPQLADRVMLLDKGKIVKIGNPDEVIKEYMELKP